MLEIKVTIGLEPKTLETLGELLAQLKGAKIGIEPTKGDQQEPKKQVKKDVSAETEQEQKVEPKVSPKKVTKVEEPVDDKTWTTNAEEVAPKPTKEPKKAELDIEDVRAVLADAKHRHGLDAVKVHLKKYGAKNLADVAAEDYGALVADLKALGE